MMGRLRRQGLLWKNRDTVLPAMVIPGAEVVLLGAIALEGMDLMVNPVTQEVVGVHGDEVEYIAYYRENAGSSSRVMT